MSGDTVWSSDCILRLNESIQHTIARPRLIDDSDRYHWAGEPCEPWLKPAFLDARRTAVRAPAPPSGKKCRTVPVYDMTQYSSASMMVMTRLVTIGSDGSGECTVSVGS